MQDCDPLRYRLKGTTLHCCIRIFYGFLRVFNLIYTKHRAFVYISNLGVALFLANNRDPRIWIGFEILESNKFYLDRIQIVNNPVKLLFLKSSKFF